MKDGKAKTAAMNDMKMAQEATGKSPRKAHRMAESDGLGGQ
jgi:hypothetical protein